MVSHPPPVTENSSTAYPAPAVLVNAELAKGAQASVVILLETLLQDALERGASDIHLEPARLLVPAVGAQALADLHWQDGTGTIFQYG